MQNTCRLRSNSMAVSDTISIHTLKPSSIYEDEEPTQQTTSLSGSGDGDVGAIQQAARKAAKAAKAAKKAKGDSGLNRYYTFGLLSLSFM